MPYKASSRLPGERASKLGHLDVINSDLVNKLVDQFEKPDLDETSQNLLWSPFDKSSKPLRLVFAVDGSVQTIKSEIRPHREVIFIKTALLRLDQFGMKKIDQNYPHPLALRDLLADSALYHSTVLPLKGISIQGMNNYDAIRKIIFDSLQDQSLGGEPYKTLKWLLYEKWTDKEINSPEFDCPHCSKRIHGLPYDSDKSNCPECGGEVLLSDVLGFHLSMNEDTAPDAIGKEYMLIHETLLLFTGIRHFWDQKKFNMLNDCLFIKDGPLSLRAQYSKLVIPIRKFFQHALKQKVPIYLMGQEKTGAFADHLDIISKDTPVGSYFILSNDYIRREVQHASDRSEPYGCKTNYGNKLFVKTGPHHRLVLSIPTGEYKDSKSLLDFHGAERTLGTLHTILSNKHESALLPIELANGIASLSTYPSAKILKIFADM